MTPVQHYRATIYRLDSYREAKRKRNRNIFLALASIAMLAASGTFLFHRLFLSGVQ